MRWLIKLAGLLLGCLLAGAAGADTVRVAVAANFAAPMREIAARFEQSSGHKVALSPGASGKFVAQIRHGAPFHLFLSADQDKPEALEKAGLVVPETRFTYAIGKLVLWSARPGFVGGDARRLQSGDFNKLALANPKLAPYGAAAVEVLAALKLRQSTEPRWVLGENIAQAYQFVASGNADLGFVALSQVLDQGQVAGGSGWIIPSELHSPIRQDAVLLNSAADNRAARALFDYLRGDTARAIIHAYGYATH